MNWALSKRKKFLHLRWEWRYFWGKISDWRKISRVSITAWSISRVETQWRVVIQRSCLCGYIYIYIYMCVCVCVCVYQSYSVSKVNIVLGVAKEKHWLQQHHFPGNRNISHSCWKGLSLWPSFLMTVGFGIFFLQWMTFGLRLMFRLFANIFWLKHSSHHTFFGIFHFSTNKKLMIDVFSSLFESWALSLISHHFE